ncbi:uncharacterized protein EURHEDRAFT_417492 [Aspergillus ruber CBS 135680]|uniref:Uncharacterized protein n=1 Tax=Aspergillus ruber (strain CBS 135680) TaxID=1388766 RepID=A0A017S2D5_ASPRC|nr:uncharacterized protein EURHEDRAFT_417492 [Aspergillus ruber CBS 135680]EYE90340.1 hypothetical protein EURHEDRAFT_417492 [Aspergillus ruber CBS 135680]
MRSVRSDQKDNVSPTSEPPIYGQRSPHIDRQALNKHSSSTHQALIKHSSTRVLYRPRAVG